VTALLALNLLDPHDIINSLSPYAELGIILIIFAETGLLFGFFLPGDSLLFTAGILAGQNKLNLALVVLGCFAAAVIGDQVGFTIGQQMGPRLFRRPDSRIFKQEHVEHTRSFFEHHGPKTVLLARFVPIVRTFAPVLAGVGAMPRRVFLAYNVVGAAIWVVGVSMLGYVLGDAIGTSIDTYLIPLVALIVLISLVPPYFEWRKARRRSRGPASEAGASSEVDELREILDSDDGSAGS
jgi:membrane-associated protein